VETTYFYQKFYGRGRLELGCINKVLWVVPREEKSNINPPHDGRIKIAEARLAGLTSSVLRFELGFLILTG
jgi:hypothetical protein